MTKLKLYEIADEIKMAIDMIEEYADEHDGDITGCEYVEILDKLEMDKKDKALNVACAVKNCKAELEAYKTEEKALKKRRMAVENRLQSIKNYLSTFIVTGEKFKDPRASIYWTKSSHVEISCDIENLPEQYLKRTVEPMKNVLKTDIKNGVEIPCVSVKESTSIAVR